MLRSVRRTEQEVLPFDWDLQTRYRASERAERAQERELEREELAREHAAYLKTPIWRAKAARVMRRDGYICRACGERQASEVHHLTYEHWGNEPLFDLVAVCSVCHRALHPDKEVA